MLEKAVLSAGSALVLGTEAANALLRLGDGNAALLYIQIIKNGAVFDPASAERELPLSREKIELAAGVLRRAGLIVPSDSGGAQYETPEYTVADIKARMDDSPEFAAIVQEAQRRLARPLSGPDLQILFGIYNALGMPLEVILPLMAFCIEEYRRRYGESRLPTMKYIEKVAYEWAKDGILTAASAEDYLHRRAERQSRVAEIKRVLGIKGRDLSPTEHKHIVSWVDMGFGVEAVELAYDKTVVKTGALTWRYMNTIMESWHSKGLHSVAEINEKDTRPARAEGKKSGSAQPSCEDAERVLRYLKNNME